MNKHRQPTQKQPFFKQRPALYFDEDIPDEIARHFASSSYWHKKYKFLNAAECGNKGKADEFQFAYCKRLGYSLVTLDGDFLDDAKYPFGNIPGVVVIKTSKNEKARIKNVLDNFLEFISVLPLPKIFLGDSKFVISEEGCSMRGKDARTRELKRYYITAGKTTVADVRKRFSY